MPWSLHPQLEGDSCPVGDLPLSRLLLANDANYPWLVLVPRCVGASEIIDLSHAEQIELAIEIAAVSRALKAVAPCDKLNVAALGNVVPQLHVHVIARFVGDDAWPGPVWGSGPAIPYSSEAAAQRIADLRGALAGPTFKGLA